MTTLTPSQADARRLEKLAKEAGWTPVAREKFRWFMNEN